MRVQSVGLVVQVCLPFIVSTCAGVQAFEGFRTCRKVRCDPLVVCSLILSALSFCSRCVVFECGSISRF